MAARGTYITSTFGEMHKVRVALSELFPGKDLPEFMQRSPHGQEYVNSVNWNIISTYLTERMIEANDSPDFSFIPSDEQLESYDRSTLLKYMYAQELKDTKDVSGKRVDFIAALKEKRDAGNEVEEIEGESEIVEIEGLETVDPETGDTVEQDNAFGFEDEATEGDSRG